MPKGQTKEAVLSFAGLGLGFNTVGFVTSVVKKDLKYMAVFAAGVAVSSFIIKKMPEKNR